MNTDKLVYYHSWKGLITVTRTESGLWEYHHTPRKILQFLNRNKKKGEKHLGMNIGDTFKAGSLFGFKLRDLILRCQLEYGDTPMENLLD